MKYNVYKYNTHTISLLHDEFIHIIGRIKPQRWKKVMESLNKRGTEKRDVCDILFNILKCHD